MTAPNKRPLVVLEESTLTLLAGSPAALKEFPFLGSLGREAPRKRGCGRCGRANGARTVAYSSAKAVIASLDSSKKNKLKALLNAQRVRLTYRTDGGRLMQLTF